ncbi:hypothetical protein TMatcc_000969 [Talaromyces marneffei ATCC 18224]
MELGLILNLLIRVLVKGGPHPQDFFSTIHDVAVFIWGIVDINGSLEQYRRGQPSGDALPPDGIPIGKPQPEE